MADAPEAAAAASENSLLTPSSPHHPPSFSETDFKQTDDARAAAARAAAAAAAAAAAMGNRKKRRGLGSVLSALKKTEASHLKRSVAESEIHSKEPSASQQPEIADLPEAVALDCEMVGSQVALVNEKGETLVNELVKPQLPVTDLRAHITGNCTPASA
ncbi:uncharacterized protein LOC34623891 [Cyclospora cayetanensis]|uniref:Uncharacterized protein LOC34623891 n=1 Tax=Cyclospora cayetanensis TaxID=88456 RepID=A0A6P6RRQ2_9EIME|nr:uncharacterized protein LOC34623891 [Cyclospora cayetanensis]